MQRVANQQQKHSSILKDSGAKLILFPRAEEREVTGRREEGETRLQKIGRLRSGGISIRNEGVLISGISATPTDRCAESDSSVCRHHA